MSNKNQAFRHFLHSDLSGKKKNVGFYQHLDLSDSAELNVGHFISTRGLPRDSPRAHKREGESEGVEGCSGVSSAPLVSLTLGVSGYSGSGGAGFQRKNLDTVRATGVERCLMERNKMRFSENGR